MASGGLNLKGADFPRQRRWYQKWSLSPRRLLPASPPPPRDGEGGGRGKEASEAIKIGIPLVCFTLECSNEQKQLPVVSGRYCASSVLSRGLANYRSLDGRFCTYYQQKSTLLTTGGMTSKAYPLYPFFMKVTL